PDLAPQPQRPRRLPLLLDAQRRAARHLVRGHADELHLPRPPQSKRRLQAHDGGRPLRRAAQGRPRGPAGGGVMATWSDANRRGAPGAVIVPLVPAAALADAERALAALEAELSAAQNAVARLQGELAHTRRLLIERYPLAVREQVRDQLEATGEALP